MRQLPKSICSGISGSVQVHVRRGREGADYSAVGSTYIPRTLTPGRVMTSKKSAGLYILTPGSAPPWKDAPTKNVYMASQYRLVDAAERMVRRAAATA